MSNLKTACRIFKEVKKEDISVNGMSIYDPDSVQFRLYKNPSVSDDNPLFYIFPITAGVTLFSEYVALNTKDCIATVTYDDIADMFNSTFVKDIFDSVFNKDIFQDDFDE